jgi:hypothetical protein
MPPRQYEHALPKTPVVMSLKNEERSQGWGGGVSPRGSRVARLALAVAEQDHQLRGAKISSRNVIY